MRKHKSVLSLITISISLLLIILFIYIKNSEKEKANRAIINYCEQCHWNEKECTNKYQNDDDPWSFCFTYLYLKPKVKKSTTGICHDEHSTYYYKTKSYKVFNSMDDCLNSGGREPYN